MALQSAISTTIQDDTNIVTGVDAGTTTNVGHHAAHHIAVADAANWFTGQRVFNVEHPDFGAVADELFLDGVAAVGDNTFTSATAAFVAADVGAQVVVLRGGASNAQDLHTQIASFNSSTSVELADAPGRSQSPARFYLSRRGADAVSVAAINDAAIAAAMTAAYDAGGGTVLLPGVGYLTAGVELERRCVLSGGVFGSMRATCLHLIDGANRAVVRNDQTLNNSADLVGVTSLWLDGNRGNQTDATTTLASGYTAGGTSLSLTSATNFQTSGSVLIGTNRLLYSGKSGNTLTGVSGGSEGTTDASASGGATVTQHRCHGLYVQQNPYNAMPEGVGPGAEIFDPQHFFYRVCAKNVRGDGFHAWGQSTTRWLDCWALYTDHFGFRPSYDTVMMGCVSDSTGRAGFYVRNTKTSLVGCDAFYAGNSVAAEGWGFFYEGPATIETGGKTNSSCLAQDCKAEGLYVRNAQRVHWSGVLDSNGTGGAEGTYAGAKLSGATNGIYDLLTTERMQDGSNKKQQNALEIQNTAIITAGNNLRVTHGATGAATVGAAIKAGSTLTTGNAISINGQGGYVNPAFSTPYVPDPYEAKTHQMTLTGNLVVSAPSNAHLGTELRFILIQDATGGRTITFNAALPAVWAPSLQPAGINIIDFVYNGTAWVQSSPPPDAPLRKTVQADATDSTSATNTTLTDLTWALAANTDYTFSYLLWYGNVAATTTGLSVGMTCPAGATLGASVTIPLTTTTVQNGMIVASGGTVTATSTPATGQYYCARVDGQVRTAGTAGNLDIAFGPDANAAITVRRGSQGLLYVG